MYLQSALFKIEKPNGLRVSNASGGSRGYRFRLGNNSGVDVVTSVSGRSRCSKRYYLFGQIERKNNFFPKKLLDMLCEVIKFQIFYGLTFNTPIKLFKEYLFFKALLFKGKLFLVI
ncbi:hypothetical protein BpHYR1_021870 [Brachionus plicatilis]|uniref:Uncharacterized protein n=1 Tax=Brachionus plicatilis TaxID=10195 RepID=A0A3M7T4A5_BRAPC|nr:hypothetical protein BpHYR1_021870 [Brachionus plicatilis]